MTPAPYFAKVNKDKKDKKYLKDLEPCTFTTFVIFGSRAHCPGNNYHRPILSYTRFYSVEVAV
jgi:hypothetical protein